MSSNGYFYVLNTRQGLSDICILQMMQSFAVEIQS